jgi:mannose/fructose-specific phosphotransferase system component IIA
MINIVVIAHGPAGQMMLETAAGVCHTSLAHTRAFVIDNNTDVAALTRELKRIFEASGEDGTLVLADIFGGTGSNITALLAQETENVEVLTGFNANMLFSALHNRGALSLKELSRKAEADAVRGIINVNGFMKS